jgi:hypothetical protein
MAMNTKCPVCEKKPGKRTPDAYFNVWSKVDFVQLLNVYYEVGLILYCLTKTPPLWLNEDTKNRVFELMNYSFRAAEAISKHSLCERCGRPTINYLGRGRFKVLCRWCYDDIGIIASKKERAVMRIEID